MSPFRMARDARDLYRGFVELLVFEDDNEDASYEIAVSARDFSRNAQAAVDDKLNFSATLMRAGEVEAANRLLKEFHDEVRDEEVALIERVNEVKAAEAVRRQGMTRVRLARVLAVAMVGSSLLSFSAAGMALAGLVRDRAEEFANVQVASRRQAKGSQREAAPSQAQNKKKLRRVNIGDVKLLLSASELRTIRELAGGSVDESGLEDLIEYLPTYLAEKVEKAIVVAAETTEEVVETVQVADLADLKAERRKARKAAAAKAEAQAEAEAEEQPTPQPSDTEDDERQGLGPDDDADDDDSADDGDEEDGGQEEEDGDNVPLVDDDDEGLL
jgi:hypothetical protein